MVWAAVEPIDQHLALGRWVETAQQPAHGRLARSDTADDADALPRVDFQGEPRKRVAARLRIAEADVDQFNMAGADFGDDAAHRDLALIVHFHHALTRIERRRRLATARDQES